MKPISFLLIMFICSFFKIFAQNNFEMGFIVTLEKDTLEKEIVEYFDFHSYDVCLCKENDGIIKYRPNQIIGYGFLNKKYYSSQIIDSCFVEVLVEGNLSLYRNNDNFFLKKNDNVYELTYNPETVVVNGQLGEKEDTKWKGIVAYLINDCYSNSTGIISNLSFNEKSLTKLVFKYNECKNSNTKDYKKDSPWTKLNIGLEAGFAISNINITTAISDYQYLGSNYRSYDPTFGIKVDLSSPRLSKHFSVQTGASFLMADYHNFVALGSSIESYFYDNYIDLTTLSVPLILNYYLFNNKYGLYIQGGLNCDFFINYTTSVLAEYVDKENVVTTSPENESFNIKKAQAGWVSALGVSRTFKHIITDFSLQYQQTPNINKTSGFTANRNQLSFNLKIWKR